MDRLPDSHPLKHDRAALIKEFNRHENSLFVSNPRLKYPSLLAESYINLSESLSLLRPTQAEAETIGGSILKWLCFPDTVEALQRLSKHYKLVILSNVDRDSFSKVLSGPLAEVRFDAVYTAEDIGSYKPDLQNFHYLLDHVRDELGVRKEQVLHTAHGLKSDHVPAKKMGISSAWIARGDGKGGPNSELEAVEGEVAFTWKFETMEDMADAVETE